MTFKKSILASLVGLLVWAFSCSYSNAQTTTTCTSTQYQSTDGTINPLTGDTCFDSANQTVVDVITTTDFNKSSGSSYQGCDIVQTPLGPACDNMILFSYTPDTWSVTQAINQALLGTGLIVDGYTSTFEYKNEATNSINGSCQAATVNGLCMDTLTLTIKAYDSNGVQILNDTYDYSQYLTNGWTVEQITSYAPTSLVPGVDLASVSVDIYGIDNGYWRGVYGPRVKNFVGSIIVSQDQCTINPLYDPSCPGYANALYNQQCTANPLYDPGCPGYAAANLTQQCSANPLYDSSCPGYSTAYYTQQCTINPTSDPSCPDYYVEMCKKDALYDSGCSGYSVAYFDQQCSLDPQYDNTCSGYVDLSGNDGDFVVLDPIIDDVVNSDTNIGTELVTTTIVAPVVATENTLVTSDNVEQSTGFQTIEDDIETEISELQSMDGETILEEDIEAEIAKLENESETLNTEDGESLTGKASMDDNIEKELAELENTKPEYIEKIPGKAMPKVDPVDSKRNKLKLLIAMKAIEAVKELEAAVTLEQQMDIQRRLLALISFVPDFNDYNKEENIDLANFYPPKPTVDHAFARWFLNDPNFGAMEDSQYNFK